MEPISDFLRQLFPAIPKEKITTLSCRHVIPKENLLTQVVTVGPRKVDFEFKFSTRGDEAIVRRFFWEYEPADEQLTELGSVLGSMIGLIPDGVVVFLPSYAFLEKVKAFWAKSGLMAKLGERKQVSCVIDVPGPKLTFRCFTNHKLLAMSKLFFAIMVLRSHPYVPLK